MRRMIPFLSRSMLILGVLMLLAGLGWGIWTRVNAPPDPVITDEGAVVVAVTAPFKTTGPSSTPTSRPTPTPTSTPLPTQPPAAEGPTPALLPEWQPTRTPPNPSPTPLLPTLTPRPTPTPWPEAQTPPTHIVAPAIGLDAKVTPMGWELVDQDGAMLSEWVVPKDAAGWHVNSARPGHGDNVVVSGHHNIKGKVFRYVVDLNPGDEITLYVDQASYLYVVTEKYILKEAGMPLPVRQKNAQWIMPTGDERLTIVTCWPYQWPGNSHRVIVVARPPAYFEALVQGAEGEGIK